MGIVTQYLDNNLNDEVSAYTTTATAGGTTTLTVNSTYQQFFTGTLAQTIVLPVTSTLVLGHSFLIVNNSTGSLTVNSSGGNLVKTVIAGTSVIVTCILASGTTAASWSVTYNGVLPNGTTATTQSAESNDTKVATDAYVDTGLALKVNNNGSVNPTNLVTNGNFELWTAGDNVAPDSWTLFGTGASIAKEVTTIKIGSYSAKLSGGSSDCYIYQQVDLEKGINYWKGRTVTFSCWIYSTQTNKIRLIIDDGVVATYSGYYASGAFAVISVTRVIPTNATHIILRIQIDVGGASAYIDGAMCVEGASIFAFSDKPSVISLTLSNGTVATTQSENDNSTKVATTAYADAKVANAITDGVTAIAPSENVVFDALALKAPLASPSFTGTVTFPTSGSTSPSIAHAGDTGTGFSFPEKDTISITLDGALWFYMQGFAFCPWVAGTVNLGQTNHYWNDVMYKTLTDAGCLGWFDEGVELQDGRIVSDVEALKSIKKHATKKTVYDAPMFDYKTFPKVSYKPAKIDEKLLPRDVNDEPYWVDKDGTKKPAADGIEMTSVFSIIIGAIKEIANKNDELIKRIKKLEDK